MSTEQKTFQATDPVIEALATEMLDGRAFSHTTPSRWREDIRNAIPSGLARLANRGVDPSGLSDEEIGNAFFEDMRTYCNVIAVDQGPIGAYLRGKYALLKAEPGGIPAYPDIPIQMLPSGGHPEVKDTIESWANNIDDDVCDSIDDQNTLFAAMNPRPWVIDGCRNDAWAKNFLGRVMDYKRARLAPLVPTVGMRLRVDAPLNRGAYFVLDSVIEVTEVPRPTGYYAARGTTMYASDPDNLRENDTQSMHSNMVRQYHLVPEDTPVGVSPESGPEVVIDVTDAEPVEATGAIVAGLNARITELVADNARLTEQADQSRREAAIARQHHEEDNQRIGEGLIRQADRRSWCSEYDEFIAELNDDLHISLPPRETEVEIEVSGYVRVPFSITVTVDGGDESDMEQRAGEIVEENYSAEYLLRNAASPSDGEVEDEFEYQRA